VLCFFLAYSGRQNLTILIDNSQLIG